MHGRLALEEDESPPGLAGFLSCGFSRERAALLRVSPHQPGKLDERAEGVL